MQQTGCLKIKIKVLFSFYQIAVKVGVVYQVTLPAASPKPTKPPALKRTALPSCRLTCSCARLGYY